MSINISAALLQRLGDQADTTRASNERETIVCPHCQNGSVITRGSMWWQTTKHRCMFCQGTGRVSQRETSDQSPSNNAPPVEWPASIRDSFGSAHDA